MGQSLESDITKMQAFASVLALVGLTHSAPVADISSHVVHHGHHGAVVAHGHHAPHLAHPVHPVAHPFHHAVHAPVHHAVHAPVHHAVHAAPAPYHPAPVVHHPASSTSSTPPTTTTATWPRSPTKAPPSILKPSPTPQPRPMAQFMLKAFSLFCQYLIKIIY